MKVRDVIVQSIEKWKQQHPPGELEALVDERVDGILSDSILELIGVETKWYGDVEVKWNSLVDADIKQLVATSVREWFVQHIGSLPVPSEKVYAALIEEYKSEYLDRFKRELYNLAYSNAERDACRVVSDALGQSGILDADYDVVFEVEEESPDDDWENDWE